jgi:hypothetical protein
MNVSFYAIFLTETVRAVIAYALLFDNTEGNNFISVLHYIF